MFASIRAFTLRLFSSRVPFCEGILLVWTKKGDIVKSHCKADGFYHAIAAQFDFKIVNPVYLCLPGKASL